MRSAFTLIELLVVITIIVVLLALLTPALDKAIYQAELVSCGAQMDAIATGAISYAASNRRSYPYRPTVALKSNETHQIVDNDGKDDRPYMKGFIALDQLLDTLCDAPVDFDEALPNTHVFIPRELWFGVQFAGNAGMHRLGDRFGWDGRRFNLLASDSDGIRPNGDNARAAHPDSDGVLSLGYTFNTDEGPLSGVNTSVRWAGSPHTRGTLDLNHAYADGSVRRVNQTGIAAEGYALEDDRLARVPHFTDGTPPPSEGQDWNQVPLR